MKTHCRTLGAASFDASFFFLADDEEESAGEPTIINHCDRDGVLEDTSRVSSFDGSDRERAQQAEMSSGGLALQRCFAQVILTTELFARGAKPKQTSTRFPRTRLRPGDQHS